MTDHIRTPNEVAIFLVGKTQDEIVPLLKEWRNEIARATRSEAYREGYDEGCQDCY